MINIPLNKEFNIQQGDYDAVFCAVGKIIKNAQEWEKEYRECLMVHKIKMDNIERKTLIKINQKMKKKKIINEKQYNILAEIIDYRNRINHEFFIENMENSKTEQDWINIDAYLNTVQTIIFEARDIVDKVKNKNSLNYIPPRTLFD